MNITIEEIIQFIKEETGSRNVSLESDINYDLGVDGDDFEELMLKFSEKYHVNMEKYIWYFHTSEEGFNPFSFIFKSPDKRVKHISVTPTLLAQFANSKVWKIDYPTHKLPKYRYDIIVSNIVIILIVLIIIYVKFFL